MGPATALKLSRVLTLAYRPFRQGLLNKLKGSRSLNNDCEYSGRITLPEPHSVSEVKRDALAGRPSAQLWKICHENKVSGWKKKISQASVQSYSSAITHLLQPIKHFAQILSVEGRSEKKQWEGLKRMPGRGQKELVASRQGDGRKDGENEEALQEAAGK